MSPLKTLANPFQFASFDVRTAVDDQDNVWFCAKDVCAVLDITCLGETLENMPEEWKGVLKLNTPGGEQDANFINESGLYHLIFCSDKPQAKAFANWVLGTVLPELRRNGFFGQLDIKTEIALDKRIDELASQLITCKNAFRHQLLTDRLRRMCNIAGQPVPDLKLIHQDLEQLSLPGVDVPELGGAA